MLLQGQLHGSMVATVLQQVQNSISILTLANSPSLSIFLSANHTGLHSQLYQQHSIHYKCAVFSMLTSDVTCANDVYGS